MATALFQCPPPTALANIPDTACPFVFDQILRGFIQRKQTTPSFTTTTMLLKATLTPLLAATASTKVVLTPTFGGLTFPESVPTYEGQNDNLYPDGAGVLVPGNPVVTQMVFTNKDSATRMALKGLMSEGDGLWFYPVNRFGQIIMHTDGSGIEMLSPGISDMESEGLNKPNRFKLVFSLPYGWSDNLTIVTPTDFAARTILQSAT